MLKQLKKLTAFALLTVFTLTAVGGCGRSDSDYIPQSSDARTAIEAAMTAWKNDVKRDGAIQPAAQPGWSITLFDGDFAAGRKLKEWSIESETPSKDGPRQFVVNIMIEGALQQETATYYVTGLKKQFAVFRDKEYALRGSQM